MEPTPTSSDAPASRNDLFFQTIHVPSPPKAKPPLRADKKQPAPPRQPSSLAVARRGHAKRPSFGRISMEQRESERERIRAEHGVDIRVLLEREYKLGEGRNAEVYLGAYRRVHADVSDDASMPWDLCAVKRMQVDRESQLAGLDEVFALRRLGPHPHIVNLIAVVDEVSLRAPPPISNLLTPPASGPPDLPRLLILLEYLPCTLGQFVKRDPRAVDLAQWTTWALQLTRTIEWLHNRGCVHGDVKMQNVLLSADGQIKLCDFTSVLFSNAAVPATDCLTVGTPAYSAPELFTSSRWTPSEGQDPTHPALSFTLDVFSLGVLLYSLATGVEPSRHVHGIMAMRHRQYQFFQSEEEDRIERMALPLRDGGLRPRDMHRDASLGRSASKRSSSTSSFGVSDAAVDRLLDPASPVHGVVSKTRQASPEAAALLRTKSLSATEKAPHNTQRTHATHLDVPGRPCTLERASSDVRSSAAVGRAHALGDLPETLSPTPASPPSTRASSAASTRSVTHGSPPRRTASPDTSDARATVDRQPYQDGAPALILPGGGRLPDAVRTLIQQMVSPIPEERPTASQVRQQLELFS
ncbi:hypothetical protein MBRA1_002235 [Malassezia brasiliensis]|uniref:Protein kinase domain-containing protein n=1 Tax=Malassezia brasiliensis TaxID=1821822 RepID=A0AAF0DTX3_9BASI|nr:hypothetical protein MBRA1_002235 [Malassezia brasiliensis]